MTRYPDHLIRVSDVLSGSGIVDTSAPWYTPLARDRGTAVHKAAELHDDGDLDWDSLDPIVRAKTVQYAKFVEECKPEVLSVEHYFEHETLGYCGTADRIVRINGKLGVLDIKPLPAPWHKLQLAAYQHGLTYSIAKSIHRRWALYLTTTGYKLVPFTDRDDWRVFQAALTVAKWKRSL